MKELFKRLFPVFYVDLTNDLDWKLGIGSFLYIMMGLPISFMIVYSIYIEFGLVWSILAGISSIIFLILTFAGFSYGIYKEFKDDKTN